MYDSYEEISKIKKNKVFYTLFPTKKIVLNFDTLIYFWPKNKSEAQFQLQYLLSILKKKSHIFIVGENKSGVKSSILMLKNWIILKKIDSAKHAVLFCGIIKENSFFKLKKYFNNHLLYHYKIRTLPGVFGHKKIDAGSRFLISTLTNDIKGSVLDIGTGSGIIAISIYNLSKSIELTLTDVNLAALLSCKINLSYNKINGNILSSNIYSNIKKRFNMIVCNPPIHRNLKMSFTTTINIIKQSINYLKPKGELRFVSNSFLSYDRILHLTFNKYKILKKNNDYKVYQAKL